VPFMRHHVRCVHRLEGQVMSESRNLESWPAGLFSSVRACQPALPCILRVCAHDRDPAHPKAEGVCGLILLGCTEIGVLGIGTTGTPAVGGFSHA
jgi:hypothetical protein